MPWHVRVPPCSSSSPGFHFSVPPACRSVLNNLRPLHDYSLLLFSRVQLFATPGAAANQASLSFTISQSLLKLMSIDWRRQWHPTPVLLPRKSHGQRSRIGCSLWGHKELDTTERLPFHFSLSCVGEGNGNPPHCSCLENPRDGGTWWAAMTEVT